MENNTTTKIYNECCNVIKELIDKYKEKPHMYLKIQNQVCSHLPNTIKNIEEKFQQQQKRIEDLTIEQESFIHNFLNNNRFFYISSTENFFYYNGTTYKTFNEDDILYKVLTSLNSENNLSEWKSKTKISIMKKIKDNSLLKSIPESITIQNVLNFLYPSFFSTKQQAKHFLTIIGDNIFKKNKNHIHLITPKAREFIDNLKYYCKIFLGNYSIDTFKYKHCEYDYDLCRVITINDSINNPSLWNYYFSDNFINFLCVACHYSIRYSSSDEYLIRDSFLAENVLYLKNNTIEKILDMFETEYLQPNYETKFKGLTLKNMMYLWKHFLDKKKLPMIMLNNNCIIKKFSNKDYNESTEIFSGIYSKFLPKIESFLDFWDKTMVYDDNDHLLEIEEITILFKRWYGRIIKINESQVLDIISYYFADVEITFEKYIQKYKCSLWDKDHDIETAMKCYIEDNKNEDITLYNAYTYYCKYYSGSENGLLVSKKYFDKYITKNYPNIII